MNRDTERLSPVAWTIAMLSAAIVSTGAGIMTQAEMWYPVVAASSFAGGLFFAACLWDRG